MRAKGDIFERAHARRLPPPQGHRRDLTSEAVNDMLTKGNMSKRNMLLVGYYSSSVCKSKCREGTRDMSDPMLNFAGTQTI